MTIDHHCALYRRQVAPLRQAKKTSATVFASWSLASAGPPAGPFISQRQKGTRPVMWMRQFPVNRRHRRYCDVYINNSSAAVTTIRLFVTWRHLCTPPTWRYWSKVLPSPGTRTPAVLTTLLTWSSLTGCSWTTSRRLHGLLLYAPTQSSKAFSDKTN